MGFAGHRTVPGACVVQTTRAHRLFNDGAAGFVRLVRHIQMAVAGNRRAGISLRAAGEFDPAFLEKGFVAAWRAGSAVEPGIRQILCR